MAGDSRVPIDEAEGQLAEFRSGPKNGLRMPLDPSLGRYAPETFNFVDGAILSCYRLTSSVMSPGGRMLCYEWVSSRKR